ncbi:MAG: response regulator [Candidatus Magasanikbacteria bacterium]|nr:response regulator [Candidatus Magasanikbacteria bacterium]
MHKKKKILITEDHKPLAKALALKLKKSGFEPVIAYDGAEALKDLKKGKYDLMILDLILPKIDGFTVLEKMKKRHVHVPVLVSTNLSQTEDEKKVKGYKSVKGYFIKTDVSLLDLVKEVKKYVK